MIVFPTLKPTQLRKKIENTAMEELFHLADWDARNDAWMELRNPIWDAIWAACKTEAGERMTMKKVREK